MQYAYLQFGKAGTPMQTVRVEARLDGGPTTHGVRSMGALGKGVPCYWSVLYQGAWRRPWVSVKGYDSNAYVRILGEWVRCDMEG